MHTSLKLHTSTKFELFYPELEEPIGKYVIEYHYLHILLIFSCVDKCDNLIPRDSYFRVEIALDIFTDWNFRVWYNMTLNNFKNVCIII